VALTPVHRQISAVGYDSHVKSVVPAARTVALAVRDLRLALGWTQTDLACRARVSQSLVSAVETMVLPDLTLATATRLLETMGARLSVSVSPPFLGDRERQKDAAHARCTNYVARRLEAKGWRVAAEVEVGGDRSRGWIDVLAYHPGRRITLVIEVKTEIHDLGAIERSLGWYEREAWAASRRVGWRPNSIVAGLLLLATGANDTRATDNRDALRRGFPMRARDLAKLVAGEDASEIGRFVAMIDPRSRRDAWLRPMYIDGRRTPEPYADYADFMHVATVRRSPRPSR
jgi:transcriptional regulator with XRE-family HTH domain